MISQDNLTLQSVNGGMGGGGGGGYYQLHLVIMLQPTVLIGLSNCHVLKVFELMK